MYEFKRSQKERKNRKFDFEEFKEILASKEITTIEQLEEYDNFLHDSRIDCNDCGGCTRAICLYLVNIIRKRQVKDRLKAY